jgi:hypothetical protein
MDKYVSDSELFDNFKRKSSTYQSNNLSNWIGADIVLQMDEDLNLNS